MSRKILSYIAMTMLAGQLGMTPARADRKDDPLEEELPKQQAQFSSVIEKIKAGIQEDGKYHIDAVLRWKYQGKEVIKGPITWAYSICFGPPAKDDAGEACYGGGTGKKTLERLVWGDGVEEEVHNTVQSPYVMIKSEKYVPMKGYQPHIGINIDAEGTAVYRKKILLQPVTDYPK